MLIAIALIGFNAFAQDKLYLTFEFMKVSNTQESSYQETENFWQKIHEQRVKSGEIVGWDLWALAPGGEDQHYQYLTVTVYNDPLKMMNGMSDLMGMAKKAYPNMTEEQIVEKLNETSKSRSLAVRLFLEEVKSTTDKFPMNVGTVASIDLMKVQDGNYDAYEKAETEVFLPMHQKMVDDGAKGSWGLERVMLPYGSDVYTTHITVNMYSGMEQYIKSMSYDMGDMSSDMTNKIQDGLKTRDMRWTYMAYLMKKVR